jgi:hypothetical protein
MPPERLKAFVFVDVDLPRNHRVESLSDPAHGLALWLAMTCYIRETLADAPLVPKQYARRLWGNPKNVKTLTEMVARDLIADRGSDYEVLRYEPRNQLKRDVEQAREKARLKTKKWRDEKAAAESNQALGVTGHVTGTGEVTLQLPSTSTSLSLSSSSSSSQEDQRSNEAVGADANEQAEKKKRRIKTRCPESDASEEAISAWASEWRIDRAAESLEFDNFLDYHRSEEKLRADWTAAWRSWLRRRTQFQREKPQEPDIREVRNEGRSDGRVYTSWWDYSGPKPVKIKEIIVRDVGE